jgi:hypothetical protein
MGYGFGIQNLIVRVEASPLSGTLFFKRHIHPSQDVTHAGRTEYRIIRYAIEFLHERVVDYLTKH